MTTQTATIGKSASNGKNMAHQKETVGTLELIACVAGKPRSVAVARFYMARSGDGSRPVYCTIWTHAGTYNSGHGRANGYGYHKQSAALQSAMDSANINLSSPIDGVGDSAMDDAMLALGCAMGYAPDSMLVARG